MGLNAHFVKWCLRRDSVWRVANWVCRITRSSAGGQGGQDARVPEKDEVLRNLTSLGTRQRAG